MQGHVPAFVAGSNSLQVFALNHAGGAVSVPAFPDPVGQSPGVWTGVFRDEFLTGTVDATKWQVHYPSDGTITRYHAQAAQEFSNNAGVELEAYLPSGVSFDANGLVLTASHVTPTAPSGSGADFSALSYTSGMLSSYPAFTFTRGYFEASILCPGNPGSWPAFWSDSAGPSWPPEIDFMEQVGDNNTFTTVSVWSAVTGTGTIIGQHVNGTPTTGYHVYGCAVKDASVTFYLDGTQVAQTTVSNEIPTTPLYLVLNHAVKGTPSGFPSAMHVAYVRAWQ